MSENRNVPLMKLRDWHCHFIVVEANGPESTRYCGEPAETGSSWCREHRAICVTASVPRVRVPERR